MTFKKGDIVRLPMSDTERVGYYVTDAEGIPEELIKHGLVLHLTPSNPIGTVICKHDKYYIVEYMDKDRQFVRLGFLPVKLRLYKSGPKSKKPKTLFNIDDI